MSTNIQRAQEHCPPTPTVTEMGMGVDPDTALIKNCPKCFRLNWAWTVCDHKKRAVIEAKKPTRLDE